MMDSERSYQPPPDTDTNDPKDKKPGGFNKQWIYLGIIALLLATNGILFFQKNKSDKRYTTATQIKEQVVADRDNLQQEYSATLARLDQLTTEHTALGNQIKQKDTELAKAKARIEEILKNKNATARELAEAKTLIAKLNGKITSYESQIAELKSANVTLTTQRDSLAITNTGLQQTNEGLQTQVDLGKILHASNIRISGIDLRKGGAREKEISKARRVDLLRIVFDIDENRLTESGSHDLAIRIINPSGTLLSNAARGSGGFINAESKDNVLYSISKSVSLKTGQPVKGITADWQQSADYEKGTYKVEIYNKGYLIGRGNATLR